jgi:hypothetical protein
VVLAAARQAQTLGDVRLKFSTGTCALVPELVASLRSIH